jgi:hypothetical protein
MDAPPTPALLLLGPGVLSSAPQARSRGSCSELGLILLAPFATPHTTSVKKL